MPTPSLPTCDDDVDGIPAASLPALVCALAALLARASARLAAERVAAPEAAAPVEPDSLLDVHEAAALIRRSVSWMRHHGHRLPGFSQPGGKGTRAAWSRAALVVWANRGA